MLNCKLEDGYPVKISKNDLPFKIKLTFDPDLKATKKIISLFNLLLFVGTFLFTSVSAYASKQSTNSLNHSQKQLSAKADTEDGDCHQSFFEKNENENETESDAQIPALLLPFIISFFQLEVLQSVYSSVHSTPVNYSTPIYLSVCNFRV